MPPITGFYAFMAGSVVFALLGSNPQMSVGADSTIAPLFAAGVAHLAPLDSPHFIALVGILAVVTGLIVLAVGALRLGWISDFLSAPIISGFMCGVGVIIFVHQLPDFFGLPVGQRHDGAPRLVRDFPSPFGQHLDSGDRAGGARRGGGSRTHRPSPAGRVGGAGGVDHRRRGGRTQVPWRGRAWAPSPTARRMWG